MKTSQRITAATVLIIIVVCMSGYTLFIPEILERTGWISVARAEDGDENINNHPAVEKNESRYNAFLEIKRKVEEKFNEIALMGTFIDLNGGIHRVLSKRVVLDVNISSSVYKLYNEHLTAIQATPSEQEWVDESAVNVIALNEYLREESIDFVLVNAPRKIDKFNSQLPSGITDYLNSDFDRLLNILCQSNVSVIDLREKIRHAGLNHYDLFFRTDHHWTPEAGLWATGVIMNKHLQDYMPGGIDLYDNSNWDITVYNDIFLGSHGRRVGRLYGGLDDFSVISPRFETELKVIIPQKNWDRTGSFAETCIDSSRLRKDYYANNTYTAYIAGTPGVRVSNIYGNGMKCLIIGDSFSQMIVPFISLSFSETYFYDSRFILGTAREHIGEFEPDVVILLSSSYVSQRLFGFLS